MTNIDFRIAKRRLKLDVGSRLTKNDVSAVIDFFDSQQRIAKVCDNYLHSRNDEVLKRAAERERKRFQNTYAITSETLRWVSQLLSGYLISPSFSISSPQADSEWFRALNMLFHEFPMWAVVTRAVSSAIGYGKSWLAYDVIGDASTGLTLNPVIIDTQKAVGVYDNNLSETLKAIVFPNTEDGSIKIFTAESTITYNKNGDVTEEIENALGVLPFVEYSYDEGVPILSRIKSRIDGADIVMSAGVEQQVAIPTKLLVASQTLPNAVIEEMSDTTVVDAQGGETMQLIQNTQTDNATLDLYKALINQIQQDLGVWDFSSDAPADNLESGIALRTKLSKLNFTLGLLKAGTMHSVRNSLDLLLTYMRNTNIAGVNSNLTIPANVEYTIDLPFNLPDNVLEKVNIIQGADFLSDRTKLEILNLPNVNIDEELERIADRDTQFNVIEEAE